MELQMSFFDRRQGGIMLGFAPPRNTDFGTALNKHAQVTVISILYEVTD